MCKLSRILVISIFIMVQIALADTGYGDSTAGSLTSVTPDAPTLYNPANHTVGVSSTVLDWDDLDHATNYTLQVSTASNFNTLLVDESGITESTFDATSLSTNTIYYWRVRASNVAGSGTYSETWDFTTDAALPVELTLFKAEAKNGYIYIQWITESENDNLGFILERSLSETNNYEWHKIASYVTDNTLKGQGNQSNRTVYTYLDNSIQSGIGYTYRLSSISLSGQIQIYNELQTVILKTPESTELKSPYPNPFNPETTISYELIDFTKVKLSVYDIKGTKVKTLVDNNQSLGYYKIHWDGKDDNGIQVATGVYLIILQTNDGIRTQKVILMR